MEAIDQGLTTGEKWFGVVVSGLAERMQDRGTLRRLHRLAIQVGSLEEVETHAGL